MSVYVYVYIYRYGYRLLHAHSIKRVPRPQAKPYKRYKVLFPKRFKRQALGSTSLSETRSNSLNKPSTPSPQP